MALVGQRENSPRMNEPKWKSQPNYAESPHTKLDGLIVGIEVGLDVGLGDGRFVGLGEGASVGFMTKHRKTSINESMDILTGTTRTIRSVNLLQG